VSLAAFSAYFNKTQTHPFLIAAGLIFLIAAVVACLTFSFRTEKAVLRYKEIWSYLKGEKPMHAELIPILDPDLSTISRRMLRDPMNWLLLTAGTVIVVAFCERDRLEQLFRSAGLL